MENKTITIGAMAKIVGVTTSTIKNWYGWAEESGHLDMLPEMIRKGAKNTRYFNLEDADKLKEFKSNVRYGMMSEYNERNWGDRNIQTKRSIEV